MQRKIDVFQRRICQLFWKIAEEKEHIAIDGMPGYQEKAQFTNGKVINLCSYATVDLLKDTARAKDSFRALGEIIHFTSRMKMETWGTLNAMEGIYRLHRHDMLEEIVDEETLTLLKKSLDWRTFVDENNHFALINKPTNYYGVAFAIARYRELLGWEPVKYSQILLDKLMDHICRYSGSLGYMDETPGQGRFDRYSILIPAEITASVLDTGWQEPELIRQMLHRSAHIALGLANSDGTGFSYGRSIGAYGETAVLQILSTAVALGGIFDEDETQLAHGYCCRILGKMIDFWYDEDMQSINMWEKGRRTDSYRNKHRILGENLSLPMQMVVAMKQWASRGYAFDCEPEGWEDRLSKLPSNSITLFTEELLPRKLAVIRDGGVVWQLPIISGGNEYFDRDPYLPVPRANMLLEAVPDVSHGAWLPCLEMKDGSTLLPTAYADSAELESLEDGCLVKLHQQGFALAGKRPMECIPGADIQTVYTFRQGSILRRDEIRLTAPLMANLACLRLRCDIMGGTVHAEGYETQARLTYRQAAQSGICLDTPHGPCRETITFERRTIPEDGVIHVLWQFDY